jgi:hypothetical protein
VHWWFAPLGMLQLFCSIFYLIHEVSDTCQTPLLWSLKMMWGPCLLCGNLRVGLLLEFSPFHLSLHTFSFLGTQPWMFVSKFSAILFHPYIVGTMYAHGSTYSFQATCIRCLHFDETRNFKFERFLMSGNYIINSITTVGNSIVKLSHKHVM